MDPIASAVRGETLGSGFIQRAPRRGAGVRRDFPIWKPGRVRVVSAGATAGACVCRPRPGFERAAEDPLGARE
jgi:hypothetical protein